MVRWFVRWVLVAGFVRLLRRLLPSSPWSIYGLELLCRRRVSGAAEVDVGCFLRALDQPRIIGPNAGTDDYREMQKL